MPTVSVLIPSYNHEKFVKECIQSILDQTFQDFEIVITDDGSTDRTVEIIESFDDPRITLFKHSINKGACIATNNCILNSSGKYISMLSSDDAWYPEKLEVQVRYLDKHPEIAAVFGKVEWIDEESNPITDKSFPYMDLFDVENRTRFDWLRFFFEQGNSLCHPCSLIRRDVYDDVGFFNPDYGSLPDFDMWIRICLKYEIEVLDQQLIRFRMISDQSNASGNTLTTHIRNRFEYGQSLNHYLMIKDPDEFLMVFPNAEKFGEITEDTLPYFLARLALESNADFKTVWGIDLLYSMLQDETMAQVLRDRYHFSHLDFIRLTGQHDPLQLSLLLSKAYTPYTLSQWVSLLPIVFMSSMRRIAPSWFKSLVKGMYRAGRSKSTVFGLMKRITPESLKEIFRRMRIY